MNTLLSAADFLAFSQQVFCQIIPFDRTYARNPGLTSVGGVPSRTTVCATLPAGNGSKSDASRVHNAIEACLSGQVLELSRGTFVPGDDVPIGEPITVRGGYLTLVRNNNGARRGTSKLAPSTIGICEPLDASAYN